MIPNRNALWARVVAEELLRSGVREVCVSPGSRSGPLAIALHEARGLRVTIHVDERSAAYFAVGAAKATGRPVAVLSTSGTAAANFYPAVVEAAQSQTPLVVLTADRPPELVGVGANQAIDQRHLYGSYPRFFADAGLPEARPDRVRWLRGLVDRAVAHAVGPPAGPVHLNFPLRDPLDPREVPGDVPTDWAGGDAEAAEGRAGGAPLLTIPPPVPTADAATLDELATQLLSRPRGLIVCGPRAAQDGFPEAVKALAHRLGYPILADPLSGLRFGDPGDALVLSGYDAFLAHAGARDALRPEAVLRFGAAPTSKNLVSFLAEAAEAFQVLVDETGRLGEETARAQLMLGADPAALCQGLVERLREAPPEWDAPWPLLVRRIEDATWATLSADAPGRPFEGAVAARLAEGLEPEGTLWVSSSLPVRDLDRFARGGPKPLRVLANRGASGIDGVVSSAAGAAHALGRPVTLLVGDLAFLHDLSGLVAAKRLDVPLRIVLLNNGGGGIFEFLPVARFEPPFTELFVAPHGLDLGRVAQALGFAHRRVRPPDELAAAIAAQAEAPLVVEVTVDRHANVEHRRALEEAVARRLDAVLREAVHAR